MSGAVTLWALSLILFVVVLLLGSREEKPDLRRIADDPSLDIRLDLNSASAAELESLPGIGPALAAAIEDFRRREGQVRDLDDLRNISGIGPAKLALLEDWVRIGGERPSVGTVDDEVRSRHEGGVER